MNVRRGLALMAFGALAAGGVLAASPAKADDADYIQALTNSGVVVTNAPAAIRTGHAICQMLTVANGEAVAVYLYTHTDVPTLDIAAVMVIDAVEVICPEEDHSKREQV